MNNNLKQIDEAWLNLDILEDDIFNPLSVINHNDDDFHLKLTWLMTKPEYFSFLCKHILNINILPSQALMLCEMWNRKFPMLIATRGFGKSFILSLYSIIRALILPKRKIVIVGAAFRQSKVLFEYMETIWNNAPLLRDICDSDSGPRRDVDRCVMRINDSRVTCLPLGDGQKIRGQRANDIISDEFASIPRDIFETVVAGFAAVSSDPIENVKKIASEKKAKKLGIDLGVKEEDVMENKDNQIILSGTAYYDFNHFATYWKKWKSIIKSKGERNKLREIFNGEDPPENFDWREYSVIRIPYELLPDGFMDAAQVARSKATVHNGIYQMEFGACSREDTLIYTDNGLKKIVDVQIGDMVLTHKGKFRPVTKKTYRHHKGKIAKHTTYGYNNPIYITMDHPYWIGDDNFFDLSQIEHTKLSNLNETYNITEIYPELLLQDILETSDRKFFYPKSSQSQIDLDQQRYIRESNDNQIELAKKFNLNQTAISYIKNDKRKPKNSIPSTIPLSYDFGCIVGYYASEGNIGSDGKTVEFALDEHKDTKFQKQLLDCIFKVFGFHGKQYIKNKNVTSININSRLVADIIKYICPGISSTKLIKHEILFSNENFMKGFITGYWNGDGHINKKFASAHCINQSLLAQLKICLSYFGISSSLLDGSQDNDFKLNISGENFNIFKREIYNKIIEIKSNKNYIINDGKSSIYPVKNVEFENYDGYVYNLEVEEDQSYSLINATVHNCFTRDSQGFFKRSLIESCVCSDLNPIKNSKNEEINFEAKLIGSHDKRYVFGVDPASEVDNFSIVVIEISEDHRKIVHCWTTTRSEHIEKVKKGHATETDFYAYCARKIRDLMKLFPCVHIAMDAQGGGIAVMEALHDKSKLKSGEHPIWPTIEKDKQKPTDNERGLHILEMCQFAKYDWLSEANHGMRKDFEDKILLFPKFDTITLGISNAEDGIKGRIYDTLEQCVMEIEELKSELSMIQMSQTQNGRDRWDTPEVIIAAGKKSKMRKDRYSALLMANMAARIIARKPEEKEYQFYGGFAYIAEKDKAREENQEDFIGPSWFTENMKNVY